MHKQHNAYGKASISIAAHFKCHSNDITDAPYYSNHQGTFLLESGA
jgi:hypothetical protein